MITMTCNKYHDSYTQSVTELLEATLNYIYEGGSQRT